MPQLTQVKKINRIHIEVGDRIDRSTMDDSEVINTGKDYADYLKEEKARNWKKRNDIAKSILDTFPHNLPTN